MDAQEKPIPVTGLPKRKYVRRVPLCTDPELKYLYKRKPGPRPGLKKGRKIRKKYEPERTDAEQRRFSRASAAMKKATARRDPAEVKAHLERIRALSSHHDGRRGIPDGWSREQAEAAWAQARARAEEIFEQMAEDGIVEPVTDADFETVVVEGKDVLVPKTDAGKAAVALKELMVVGLGPMGTQQTKVSALMGVLKFTKSPPAQKVEVSKAEDLLAKALAEIKDDDAK